ncbi:hypothetical protein EV702DRAFT_1046653 [Suillus placidus]|uniref:Uncharacterized protein n=1 Tax=Suillus placidus TaxID=48579 RepID=A0A9P7D1N6_9AGAM|nr:hypothetical protein EV702DRAFT_1046653 [Suillus placidus]
MAPKTTGGVAPRRTRTSGTGPTLQVAAEALVAAKALVPPQAVKEMVRSCLPVRSASLNPSNDFCLLCQDGSEGSCMYECDEPGCPCLEDLKHADTMFRCIHCHTALDQKLEKVTPYHRFLRAGEPILSSFLPIGGRLEVSTCSQMSAIPTLIVHFQLIGLEDTASLVDAARSYLASYFPDGRLRLSNVVFDLGTDDKTKNYSQECAKLVNDIMKDCGYQKLCIVITNHTNNDNGNPYFGYGEGDSQAYITDTVPEFMNALLRPWRKVIKRAKDTTLFFLGCGALVNKPEAFRGLRFRIYRQAFSPILYLPSFAQLVIVEGFTLSEAFPDILNQSGLGMHTDVIRMTLRSKDNDPAAPLLECIRYSWAHAKALSTVWVPVFLEENRHRCLMQAFGLPVFICALWPWRLECYERNYTLQDLHLQGPTKLKTAARAQMKCRLVGDPF